MFQILRCLVCFRSNDLYRCKRLWARGSLAERIIPLMPASIVGILLWLLKIDKLHWFCSLFKSQNHKIGTLQALGTERKLCPEHRFCPKPHTHPVPSAVPVPAYSKSKGNWCPALGTKKNVHFGGKLKKKLRPIYSEIPHAILVWRTAMWVRDFKIRVWPAHTQTHGSNKHAKWGRHTLRHTPALDCIPDWASPDFCFFASLFWAPSTSTFPTNFRSNQVISMPYFSKFPYTVPHHLRPSLAWRDSWGLMTSVTGTTRVSPVTRRIGQDRACFPKEILIWVFWRFFLPTPGLNLYIFMCQSRKYALCVKICVYVCKHLHMHACIWIFISIDVHIYLYMYTYIYIYVYKYVYVRVNVHICMPEHIFIQIHLSH